MQADLINPEIIWKETILAKIHGLVDDRVEENLSRCGREEIYRTCEGCGDWSTFYYRCNMKFCPQCNWRISRQRAELIGRWTKRISQPKHLVTTRSNFETLTRRKIRENTKACAAMRRSKLFRGVHGGCISTEITNGGNGWHLHNHWLIDTRWLDAAQVAVQWGKRVGQEFAIVKIKDVRNQQYLGEVTKYVVKPSELAGWNEHQIAQFIHAIKGVRFFATFGTLFHQAKDVRREIHAAKPPPAICKCGCGEFRYEDQLSATLREIRTAARRR